jgi:pimeloyl-ACP methyl ester carboxylesterase
MSALFEFWGFNSKKKVILMGYDLGGAIALSCALHPKLSKAVEQIVLFHPTWTDSIERVAGIALPTLLFWSPV